jgi:hypothetical protein
MQYSGKDLRVVIDTVLHEQITVGGQTVKCYDTKAPTDAIKPYILLSSHTQTGNNFSKDRFGYSSGYNIEIVDGFNDVDNFDRSRCDYVADQALTLLRQSTTSKLTTTRFNIISLNLASSNEVFVETERENLFRLILTLEIILNINK